MRDVHSLSRHEYCSFKGDCKFIEQFKEFSKNPTYTAIEVNPFIMTCAQFCKHFIKQDMPKLYGEK